MYIYWRRRVFIDDPKGLPGAYLRDPIQFGSIRTENLFLIRRLTFFREESKLGSRLPQTFIRSVLPEEAEKLIISYRCEGKQRRRNGPPTSTFLNKEFHSSIRAVVPFGFTAGSTEEIHCGCRLLLNEITRCVNKFSEGFTKISSVR